MKYLICIGHPAQFHLFKNIIAELHRDGHVTEVLITSKDILEYLCEQGNFQYNKILPRRKNGTKLSLALNFLKRYGIIYKTIRHFKPDILLGSEVTLPILGKTFGIPSIVFSEDDAKIIPQFAMLAYPFATKIIAPDVCDVGKWGRKKISYPSYHELAYLHPNYFKPNINIIRDKIDITKPYYILRFAKLSAHHDNDKTGITTEIAEEIIKLLSKRGNIYITSERELEHEFEKYRISIDPINIHHVLAFADMYIGDSQTMAAEAAVLGTPSIRFNDFAGKIGYLNDLEDNYNLGFGFNTNQVEDMLTKIKVLLNSKDLHKEWHKRKQKMLSNKIDVTAFMIWFIENYPESVKIMQENPNYQLRFK